MKLAKREVRAHKNAGTNIKDDLLLLFYGTGLNVGDMKLVKREVRAHKNAVTNIEDDLLLLF
jgi:hypothetical protein